MSYTFDADDESSNSPSLEEMAAFAQLFGSVASMPADTEAAAALKDGVMKHFIAQAYLEYPEFLSSTV